MLKGVLQNETVELETEMVVAIMKDVASALKYLHQLDPPALAKDMSSSGVVLNADYGAQLVQVHMAMVRGICCVSICCCSIMKYYGSQCCIVSIGRIWLDCSSLCMPSVRVSGRVLLPYLLKAFHSLAAFIKLFQARHHHTYLFGLGW